MIDFNSLIEDSPRLSEETKRIYKGHVKRWVAYAGSHVEGWTPQIARAYYDRMIADGIGIESANTSLGGVQHVIDRARELGLTAIDNPVRTIERRRLKRGETPTPLSVERARALLAGQADGSGPACVRNWAMLVLELYTGMRRSSLVAVQLDRVVPHEEHVDLVVPIQGVTKDLVAIPVHRDVWAMLSGWGDALAKQNITSGPLFRAVADDGSIREGLTVHGVTYIFNRCARRAGLRSFHGDLLRHTFLEWCREGGISEEELTVVTGFRRKGRDALDGARIANRVRWVISRKLGFEP